MNEQLLHDDVVEQVTELTARYKELGKIRIASQNANLRRAIAAAESRLNRQIFELYGLDDNDIALIEERAAEPAIAV